MSEDLTRIVIEGMIVVGGVITTWITLKYQQKRRQRSKKPDRMDTIYDGYEKLIITQQHEISRKTEIVSRLEKIVDTLELELLDTKRILQETKDDLYEARQQNIQFKKDLNDMRQKT